MPAGRIGGLGSFRLNQKGYPLLNSRKQGQKFVHRAVFEIVAGRPPRDGFHIHHMNWKLCWCPGQLLEIQAELHPSRTLRDPYTGEFMTISAYRRRYGE
jgi:hypothetical protein